MFGKRSDQPRTSQDRARAAAERAARREGRPLPPEAFEDSVRPPDVPSRPVRNEPVDPPRAREPEPPREEPEAPRLEAASEAARRDEPVRETPPIEHLHQPTVEYTPSFQTDEHELPRFRAEERDAPRDEPELPPSRAEEREEPVAPRDEPELPPSRAEEREEPVAPRDEPEVPAFRTEEHEAPRFQTEEHEAPLGDPREDEPEFVASRRSASTATAEHDLIFDEEPEEEEPPPVKPLRAAPPRADDAPMTPRKRPAPNAPRNGRAARAGRGRRTPPPANVGRGTGNGHWGRRIFAVVALAVLAGLLYGANQTFQPFHGDPEGTVKVTIPEGSDAGEISTILADAGVIDSATFFQLSATIDGSRGSLRPGDYTLQKGMSNDDVVAELTKVPVAETPAPTVTLTLVEGPSRRENAPVVDKSEKVKGEYAKASGSKATLGRIRELGAPRGTKTAEGFLFPATYELPEGSTAGDLVKAQLDAFAKNWKEVDMSYAKRKNLTRYDVLIIASLIEREASLAKERRLVSAVIYNRLAEGIPLGIDATTRYSTNNWTRAIKQSELDKDEPFNTRLKRGLPPTPIGNPGLASIKAAANPSRKKYLYYVRKTNDDSGEHGFYTNYSDFEKAVARYNASRDGG